MSGPARPGPACRACDSPFGSPVAFCPFCGTAQAVALAPEPLPELVPVPVMVPEMVLPSPWERPQTAVPVRAAASMVPPPPQPPIAAPRSGGRLRWVVLGAMGLGAAILLLRAPPTGTLVATVQGPAGPLATGRILVDGTAAGAPGERLTLSTGPHRIGFEETGYRADPVAVVIARNEAVSAGLTAREVLARLTLTTEPSGAIVRLRGRSWGPTPVTLDLPAGSHDIVVALSGYTSKTVPVRLERGEARSVSIDLAAIAPPAPRFTPAPFERGIVVAGGGLLTSPNASSEIGDALAPFTEVQVLGQVVTDDTWLQLRAGSRQGFMRAGAVESWTIWAQRNSASGLIDGMTPTMRLVVSGRPYTLFGVQAPDASASTLGLSRIQASLTNLLHGAQARCVPADPLRFQCKTAEGRDIAEMYLLNGAALPGDGALPYYTEAARLAREKQKGMWTPP